MERITLHVDKSEIVNGFLTKDAATQFIKDNYKNVTTGYTTPTLECTIENSKVRVNS
jgi:hypothetical protein